MHLGFLALDDLALDDLALDDLALDDLGFRLPGFSVTNFAILLDALHSGRVQVITPSFTVHSKCCAPDREGRSNEISLRRCHARERGHRIQRSRQRRGRMRPWHASHIARQMCPHAWSRRRGRPCEASRRSSTRLPAPPPLAPRRLRSVLILSVTSAAPQPPARPHFFAPNTFIEKWSPVCLQIDTDVQRLIVLSCRR